MTSWPWRATLGRIRPLSVLRCAAKYVHISVSEAAEFIRAAVAETRQEYPESECTVDASGYGSLTGGQINLFGGKVSLEILGSDSRELAEYSSRVAQRLREVPSLWKWRRRRKSCSL